MLKNNGIVDLPGPEQAFWAIFGHINQFYTFTVDFFTSSWKPGEEETYSTFLGLGKPILRSKMSKNTILGGHKGPE